MSYFSRMTSTAARFALGLGVIGIALAQQAGCSSPTGAASAASGGGALGSGGAAGNGAGGSTVEVSGTGGLPATGGAAGNGTETSGAAAGGTVASDGAGGSAGVRGSAGSGATGGSRSVDGAQAAGGAPASGGARASGGAAGGAHAAGGATGAAGATGRGGAIESGGSRASGGTTGSGGGPSGGATGAGGSAVDGGASAKPYKGVASCTCAERTTLKVSWYYNWTVTPDNCTTGGEFVPMYSNHPNTNPTPQAVSDQISRLVSAGYKYVLGFNEPNKSDQANMTVADAIALWPAMTSNPAILVGSPATSADGKSWFEDFWTQVQAHKLRVDFIAIHWYGWNAGSCDPNGSNLESYIKWAEGLPGDLPIWLTEWGCMNASNPDDATVQAFYQGAVKMFAKHPRLERYAWYQWDPHNYLTNSDHSLTPFGEVYASEPATK
jgi:hypothetical protein